MAHYILTHELRAMLSKPIGPVVRNVEAGIKEGLLTTHTTIISVGDICTRELIEHDVMPAIAVIDRKTRRNGKVSIDFDKHFDIKIGVENPPGTLTEQLFTALASAINAIKNDKKTLIVVSGEEDLAALAAIKLSPIGITVIYGLPDKGLTVVKVSTEAKKKVEMVLQMMEANADGN